MTRKEAFVTLGISAAIVAVRLVACGSDVPDPPEGVRGAFFIGQLEDARGLSHQGQPVVDFNRYQLIVWSPSVPEAEAREAAPHAIHLAYTTLRSVPTYGGAGSVWDRQRAKFDSSSYWRDGAGGIIELYPTHWELLYTEENARAKADYVLKNLAVWDGIYIDNCHAELPERYALTLAAVTGASTDAIMKDFKIYRDTFVHAVRAGLEDMGFEWGAPPGRSLVANVGWGVWLPEIDGLPLDGVTCEEWWLDGDEGEANRVRMIEAFDGYDRRFCVSWEWNAGIHALPGIGRYRAKYDSIEVWPDVWPD